MRLKFIPPLMPTLVEKPPEGDDWIHEIELLLGPRNTAT